MPAWLARPEEAADVARLLIGFRDYYGDRFPPDEVFTSGVARLIEDPDTEYLLAAPEDGAAPAGVAQLRFRWGIWRNGGDCLVEDLFVEEQARGGGLGRALLELATERALARGCTRMELDANEENAAALGLYRAFGFRESRAPGAPRDLYLHRHLD